MQQRLATQKEEEEFILGLLVPTTDDVTKKALVQAVSGHEWCDVRFKTICETIGEMLEAGVPIDWLQLIRTLQDKKLLSQAGGGGGFWFLVDLCDRAWQSVAQKTKPDKTIEPPGGGRGI